MCGYSRHGPGRKGFSVRLKNPPEWFHEFPEDLSDKAPKSSGVVPADNTRIHSYALEIPLDAFDEAAQMASEPNAWMSIK